MESGRRDEARLALAAALSAHHGDFWGGRIHFVLGQMDIEDKRSASALQHLRDPLILKSGLEDLSVFYQGYAYSEMKDYDGAAEAFGFYLRTYGLSAFSAEAAKMLGEAHAEGKHYAQAAAAFEEAVKGTSGWEAPSLCFKAGDNHEKAGELTDALRCFERLFSQYPSYYRDKEVQQRIRSLRVALRLPAAIPVGAIEERARSFAEAGYHKSAYAEYSGLRSQFPAYFMMENLAYELGVESLRSGNKTLARSLLAEAAARDETGRCQLALAELLRDTGKDPSPNLEAAAKVDGGAAETALYRLFLWRQGRGEFTSAGHCVEELAARFPGDLAALALWKRAWALYGMGAFQEAGSLFLRCSRIVPRGTYAAGSLYWAGRAFERCSRGDAATSLDKELDERFPRTIYAHLAGSQTRQGATLDPPPTDIAAQRAAYFQSSRAAMSPEAQLSWDRAELLRLCRLNALALKELAFLEGRCDDPTPVLVKRSVIYNDTNAHRAAIVTLRQAFPDYLTRTGTALPRFVWEIFYPLKYADIFEEQGRRLGIRSSLLLGLSCQESCFNPVARSGSGAVGVMQLLPSTARYVARRHRLSYSSSGLLDPARNIEMGVLYLDGLLDQFGRNEVYALIGYNAGPGRVTSWKRMLPRLSGLEIAENAAFTETRNYVITVLQNSHEYQRLYGIQ